MKSQPLLLLIYKSGSFRAVSSPRFQILRIDGEGIINDAIMPHGT